MTNINTSTQLTRAQKEIPSYPGPPFPLLLLPPYVESDMLEFWKHHQPTIAPDGWSIDPEEVKMSDSRLYMTYSRNVMTWYG